MTGQVSRMQGQTANGEMGLIGYVVAAGIAVVLLPVLPFVVVVWLLLKVSGGDREETTRSATGGET